MSCSTRSQLRVLVAAGSPLARAQLRAILCQDPGLHVVAESESGAEAIKLFFRHRPAAVLLDVCLPDGNGFEVMQCFKQAAPDCAVILLSEAFDPCVEEVSRMLGASEVCYRGAGFARVREVLRALAGECPPVSV